ncbi:PPC domain-containing protein [Tautonia rosea]|uniref:PPC domain-containing protein n=1 Tax=Tautonia rosea TaxID=2728037 RepID=UPI001473269F|nr:PPC domain-containing protein [Tautonia rosea]
MSRSCPKGPEHGSRRLRWLAPMMLAAGIGLGLGVSSVEGQMPKHRLDVVFPPGGTRGEAVEVRLGGAEMESASGLWFDHPGITTERVEGDASPPRFRVTIGPEVPLGLHDVRVVGPLGVSNPKAFVVGQRPEGIEQEPNNGPAEAGGMTVGQVVNGQIDGATDVDWFAFEGKADQRVLIDLAAVRIDSRLDGEVRLYDAEGRELAYGHGTVGRDPLIDTVLPGDGTYRVEVRDVIYAGSPQHVYRLTVHEGPHVDAVVPSAVDAGATVEVTLLGRNLGGEPSGTVLPDGQSLERLTVSVTVPPELQIDPDRPGVGLDASPGGGTAGFWHVHETDRGAADPVFLAEAMGPVVVEEGPSDHDDPMVIAPPIDLSGDFREVDDEDVYRFEATKGQVWMIEVWADRIGSPVDATLLVQRVMGDGSLRDILEGDDQGDPGTGNRFGTGTVDPVVRFEAPEDGTYVITVGDLYNAREVDPTAVYRLVVRPQQPDYRLFVAPNDPGNPEGLTLWSGGRSVAYVLAHRFDGMAGPIRVEAEGLPAGVSSDPVVIAANQVQAPMIFSASAGAPPKLGTVRLVGRRLGADGEPVDEPPRVAVAGTITRPPPGGNAPTPARVTRGLVMALRPEAATRLSVVPNAVTVPQGGSFELTARISRSEGVQGEFPITPDALPNNLAIANTKIEAEKDAVAVPVTVAENVEPGVYTIFLRAGGKATVPDPRNPEATMEANLSEPSNPIILTVRPKEQ